MNFIRIENACVLNCTYCDIAAVDAGNSRIDNESIARAIVQSSEESDTALCFSGGEPLLNSALPHFIKFAKKKSISQVGVETTTLNLNDEEVSARILIPELDFIRVMIPASSALYYDSTTGTNGLFERFCKSIKRVVDTEKIVIAVVPVTTENIQNLNETLKWIKRQGINKIVMKPVLHVADLSQRNFIPNFTDLKNAIGDLLPELKDPGLEFSFESCSWCALLTGDYLPEQVAPETNHYYNYSRKVFSSEYDIADYVHPSLCDACLYNNRCPGISVQYLDEHSDAEVFPIPVFGALHKGDNSNMEVIVRINTKCNQKCPFCWVKHDIKEPSTEETLWRIRYYAGIGIRRISISGGEPTIHKNLIEFFLEMKRLAYTEITLQTNAVKCRDCSFTDKLKEAGVTTAFVSFHSPNEKTSDEITGVPGTYLKTVEGIRNLLKSGIKVIINVVVNSRNYKEIPELAEFVFKEFHSERNPVQISFSYVAPMGGFSEENFWTLPRYSDAAPYLEEALVFCIENKVPYSNLSGQCGIPQCILDGKDEYFIDRQEVPLNESSDTFVKIDVCRECRINKYCYGIRQAYIDIHGVDEFHKI